MKRTIISVTLLCILAGILAYLGLKGKKTETPATVIPHSGWVAQALQQQKTGSDTVTGDVEISSNDLETLWYAGGWEYKPFFTQTAKQALADKKNVILYFYANRDPTDQSLDQDIQERKERIPANTIILRLDFDSSEDFKKAFSVTQQNTLVYLDSEGNEKTRRAVGITSLSQIIETMKSIGY